MARAALRVGVVLAILAVIIAGTFRGLPGALTALGAVVLVVGQFAITGRSLAWAAKFGPTAVQATALGGFGLRLMIYAGLIIALRPVEAIDGPVLAITTAASLILLLAYEVRLVMTHSEMWFVTLPGDEVNASPKTLVSTLSGKDSA